MMLLVVLYLAVVAVDGAVMGSFHHHEPMYNIHWNAAAGTRTTKTTTIAADRREERTKYWNIRRKNRNLRSLVGGGRSMVESSLPTPTIRSSVVADVRKKGSKIPSIVDENDLPKGGKGINGRGMGGMRGGKGGMGPPIGNGMGGMNGMGTMGGMNGGKGGGAVGMGGKGGMGGGMGSKTGKGGGGGKCNDFQFSANQRRLQFDGENCSPNALAVAHEDPQLSMFVYLIEKAELDFIFDCAGPFTVLAPVNSAFAALDPELLADLLLDDNVDELRQFLLYHILPGISFASDFQEGSIETLSGDSVTVSVSPNIMFNDAVPITTDILSCNGIMHTINDLLFPDDTPEFCDTFDFVGPSGGTDCSPNILEVARRNPSLSIILDLIDLAGLTEVFACRGPFTLLLPNDAAFANLSDAMFDALRNPDNVDTLRDVLLYHILPGSFPSTDLQAGPLETLLSGAFVSVALDPIKFDDASVVTADRVGCNGFLHVIDTVLLAGSSASPTQTPIPETIPPSTTAGPTAAPSVGTVTPTSAPFTGQTNIPTPPPSATATTALPSSIPPAASTVPSTTTTTSPFGAPSPPIQSPTVPTAPTIPTKIPSLPTAPTMVAPAVSPSAPNAPISAPTITNSTNTNAPIPSTAPSGIIPSTFPNGISPSSLPSILPGSIVPSNSFSSTPPNLVFPSSLPESTAPSPSITSVAPSILSIEQPTSSPVGPPISVNVDRFFMSYVSESTVAPTPEQYEQLRNATAAYYRDFLNTQLAGDAVVLDVDFDLDFTLENAARPASRFNTYMEYSKGTITFAGNSTNVPDSMQLETLISNGVTTDYLLNTVRPLVGTPFESVNEGYLRFL